MMPVTAVHLGQVIGNATQLLHLDTQWSDPAKATPEMLQAVGKQMQTLLGGISTEQQFLSSVANEIGDGALAARVQTAAVEQNTKSSVNDKFGGGDGALVVTQNHVQQISVIMPAEINAIQQQLDQLAGGGEIPGDMTPEGRCVLGFVCLLSEAPPVQAAGIILIAANC
jgi:hypothetical protein